MKVLAWNIEHFKGTPARLQRVVDHIQAQDPDIFALFEVKSAHVQTLVEEKYTTHDFALTDGPQVQEILVGWRRNRFDRVTFTQKRQFKAHNPFLRPGALLSVKEAGENYSFLFLHTDSGTTAADFGNRYEMFDKVWKLKAALDRQAGGPDTARFAVLGDLNTMGMQYPTRRVAHRLIDQQGEIASLDAFAGRRTMSVLRKSHDVTYNNGRLKGDLDHVIATDNIPLKVQGQDANGEPFHVAVEGWNQLSGSARRSFIDGISDHSSIRIDIE